MRDTDGSGVEWEHVKTISAGWIYTDSILGLDGGSGSAAGRSVFASARAKNATEDGPRNYKDSDGDTKLDPAADLFLRRLWRSDITGGCVVVWVTRAVRGGSVVD